jgi:hypothetical protein
MNILEKKYPYAVNFFNFEYKRLKRIFSNKNIFEKSLKDKIFLKHILRNRKRVNKEKIKELVNTLEKIY